MKKLVYWLKWIKYRIGVTREFRRLNVGNWSTWEHWKYSSCFKYMYDELIKQGDEPNPQVDVEEELHCWEQGE